MIVADIRQDMARICTELERVLGPSEHQGYLHYIASIKPVLLNPENPESKILHHVLPQALFPKFRDLFKHPWNGVYLTKSQHQMAHASLLMDYPGRAQLSDALKIVWRTKSDSPNENQMKKIIKLARVVDGRATMSSSSIARKVGVNHGPVRNALKSNGIKPMGREAQHISAKKQERIIRLAKVVDGKATVDMSSIMRKVSSSYYPTLDIFRKNGIKPMTLGEAQQIPAKKQQEIIRLAKVVNGKATMYALHIARKAGVSRVAVSSTLKRVGIKPMNQSEAGRLRSNVWKATNKREVIA